MSDNETSLASCLRDHPRGISLSLTIRPRSKRTQVLGVYGDTLKIAVAGPPVDEKANQQLLKFLADALGCPRNALSISHGAHTRQKVVLIEGVSQQKVLTHLVELLPSTAHSTCKTDYE